MSIALFNDVSSLSLTKNIITLDASALFYNISEKHRKLYPEVSPLVIFESRDTSTINNQFYYDIAPPSSGIHGFIEYLGNHGINCLSGNTFTNYALTVIRNEITSCFIWSDGSNII